MPRVLRLLLILLSACFATNALQGQTAPIPANHIRIHYHRADGAYTGWTVYAFGDTTEPSDFGDGPVPVSGTDSFGAYFDVGVTTGATNVGHYRAHGQHQGSGTG